MIEQGKREAKLASRQGAAEGYFVPPTFHGCEARCRHRARRIFAPSLRSARENLDDAFALRERSEYASPAPLLAQSARARTRATRMLVGNLYLNRASPARSSSVIRSAASS